MPARRRTALLNLVGWCHAKKRTLRFYGLPDSPAIWTAALEAGADQVGAHNLREAAANEHRFYGCH
jgi:hypothetical protein